MLYHSFIKYVLTATLAIYVSLSFSHGIDNEEYYLFKVHNNKKGAEQEWLAYSIENHTEAELLCQRFRHLKKFLPQSPLWLKLKVNGSDLREFWSKILKNIPCNLLSQLDLQDQKLGTVVFQLDTNVPYEPEKSSWSCFSGLFSSQPTIQYPLLSYKFNDGIAMLTEKMYGNHSITSLNLRGNSLNYNNNSMSFFRMLASNDTLTHLDLSANAIGDVVVGYLVSALEQNITLKVLNLADNYINDAGVLKLVKTLESNKILELLYLMRNDISEELACELTIKSKGRIKF